MKEIRNIVILIALVPFSAIFSGYALSVLWGWFFVPLFGLPEITIPGAIGTTLVIQSLCYQDNGKTESGTFNDLLIKGVAMAVMRPGFALIMGYVVVQWL